MTSLNISGVSVQTIYRNSINGEYMVNRRYQRKLVWSIEEKAKFIESLLQGFPVPMILLSKMQDSNGKYEILDGMQRLNAVISFIEGEFSVNGAYFDLEQHPDTKNNTQLSQKNPKLDSKQCGDLLNYNIPFSIFSINDSQKIDECFRRINTGGKQLSKQEVRQAGVLSNFSELVRKCSIYVRGDSTRNNILDLHSMKQISLSNKKLKYGINISDIFWVKHKIITSTNIRESRDEELVAHLLSYMIDDSSETTSYYLNDIYNEENEHYRNIESKIQSMTAEKLFQNFCFTFEEIKKVLGNHIFTKLVYANSTPNKAHNVYQVLFIAFYDLLFKENYEVHNHKALCKSIENLYPKHLQTLNKNQKWTKDERRDLSDSVKGLIKRHFIKSKKLVEATHHCINLENLINQAKTEQNYYDFKIGFHGLHESQSHFKEETLKEAIKSLVAMTNTTTGDCYIIVGVADSEKDTKRHQEFYKTTNTPIEYNGFFITGIDSEVNKNYRGDIDNYIKHIHKIIDTINISNSFKKKIKEKTYNFTYNDREVLIISASRNENPEVYDGKFFVRNHSSTIELKTEDFSDFFIRFQSQKEIQ